MTNQLPAVRIVTAPQVRSHRRAARLTVIDGLVTDSRYLEDTEEPSRPMTPDRWPATVWVPILLSLGTLLVAPIFLVFHYLGVHN